MRGYTHTAVPQSFPSPNSDPVSDEKNRFFDPVSIKPQKLTREGVLQARRKQFGVGPAKIGWSAEDASALGGSGDMLPREIF